MRKTKLNETLRPIGARALKSAMDTLRPHLSGASVLDLYAGHGRLGFSAVEEGATSVTFVELDSKTLFEIKDRAKHPTLKAANYRFQKMEALLFLDKIKEPDFDLVFCDPPFEDWKNAYGEGLLTRLVKALKPGSILLVKHPSRVVLSSPNSDLRLWKSTVFGESGLTYFLYGKDSESES